MDLETLKEEIRARSDIVDVIGRYVRLQKVGGHHKGLCPFHQEKTPSFHVDPRKQSYYCFGCHAGGDVFSFVMEHEHVDFMSAMERLANQAGVPFDLDRGSGRKGPSKERLFEIHEHTATWYESLLWSAPEGREARDYLQKRKLKEETARDFRLGFAPDSFDTLLGRLRQAGFTDGEIEASGLVSARDEARQGEKLYDRFRGRLMFPIRDELSRVIGFSGRVLRAEQNPAKYVNSPETLLFKKSRVLYGIDRARTRISSSRKALLCEGQLDVIRCHESGLDYAVAAQGTAITEEHAHILKKYADEVILLLDADAAGVKAALRSSESLLQAGLVLRVASVPDGEDPDSLVLKAGPQALNQVVKDAETFILFQIRTLLSAEEEINEASRMRVVRAVLESIGHAPEAAMRESMINQAAEVLGIRPEALRQDVQPVRPPPQSAMARTSPAPVKTASPRLNRMPTHEDLLLELLGRHPELIAAVRAHLRPEHISNGESRELLKVIFSVNPPTENALQDAFREHPLRSRFAELMIRKRSVSQEEALHPARALEQMVLMIREDALKRRLEFLNNEHEGASPERKSELENDIWQLTLVSRKFRECRASGQWETAVQLLEMYD